MKILGMVMNWVMDMFRTTVITIDGFSFTLMSILIWSIFAFLVGVLAFSFFKN